MSRNLVSFKVQHIHSQQDHEDLILEISKRPQVETRLVKYTGLGDTQVRNLVTSLAVAMSKEAQTKVSLQVISKS